MRVEVLKLYEVEGRGMRFQPIGFNCNIQSHFSIRLDAEQLLRRTIAQQVVGNIRSRREPAGVFEKSTKIMTALTVPAGFL